MSMGLDMLQKDVSKSIYAYNVLINDGVVIKHKYDIEQANEIDMQMLETMPDEWLEAKKINHAYYERVRVLKKKIANMLMTSDCLFLTFTFTDKTLQNTSCKTRRQKVIRYLKAYKCPYIANIDYGKKNGREHYHAIIQAKQVDYTAFKYGALNGKKISSTNDYVKIAKYISKLTNHAVKETTKRNCIIYSR